MKKFILLFIVSFAFNIGQTLAQEDFFKYQAVARDENGGILKNQNIMIEFSINENSSGQTLRYIERHETTTNDLGIFSLNVGSGVPFFGNFSDIDWGAIGHSMAIRVDFNEDLIFEDMGSIQLLAVPYALHAKTVEDKDDADADPNNEIQALSISGNQLTISGGNTINLPTGGGGVGGNDEDPNNEIQTLSRNGNQVELSLGGGSVNINDNDADSQNELQTIQKNGNTVILSDGGGSFTDAVNDADADPNNEIQALSISGNQLTISGGNTINLPTGGGNGGNDEDPNNEIQTLSRIGNQVELSLGGGSVNINDDDADPNNEIQIITKNGNNLFLSNGGGSVDINDADADDQNEIQFLSINGDQLTISGGNTINLPTGNGSGGNDEDPNNEIQTITRNGDQIELSLGGGSASVNDADANAQNEIQNLQLTGTNLSISQSNTIDLTPIASKWIDDGPNQIKYEGDVARMVDFNNPQRLTEIEAGYIEMGGFFNTVKIDEAGLDFTTPNTNNADYAQYSFDGVTFERESIGLLLPQTAQYNPFGVNLNDSVNFASYNTYGTSIYDSQTAANWNTSQFKLDVHNGIDFITRMNLDTSTICFKNDADWKSIEMGTDFLGGGFLNVYNGGGTDKIAEIGYNIFGIPQIALNDGGFVKVALESLNGAGNISTFGASGSGNTYIGTSVINPDHGELGIMDEVGITKAGIILDNNSNSEIYSYGSFTARDNTGSIMANIDQNGFSLLNGNLNTPIMSISRDIFTPTSTMNLYGENGSTNFTAGQSWNGSGNNGGFAGVCDKDSNSKAGMEIKADESGRLFSVGTIDITNLLGQNYAQMNQNEIQILDLNTANPVTRLARYSGSNTAGELRTAGENSLLNIFAGPNFLGNDLNSGLLAVADLNGNIIGGLEGTSNGKSNLFSNKVSVKDDNGNDAILLTASGSAPGQIWTYANGNATSFIGNSNINPGTGFISIYDNASPKASMYVESNTGLGIITGDLLQTNGVSAKEILLRDNSIANGNVNVYMGEYLGAPGYGSMEVYDPNGFSQAGIFVNPNTNEGVVWGDIKNFRMDHPTDETKDIVYASLEGPEAAAYARGTSTLENGRIFVEFSEDYRLVANAETMTIQLTPLYSNTIGLAVVEKTDNGFWVEERMGGQGNFEFDWYATCVRKGYENFKPIRDKYPSHKR